MQMRTTNPGNILRSRRHRRFIGAIALAVVVVFLPTISAAEEPASPQTDYSEVSAAINATMRANHFDPAVLDAPEYQQIEAAISELGKTALTDESYISAFYEIWRDAPFSHVGLQIARQSAADLADYLDTMRVGDGSVQLSWRNDDIAILVVNTMMGVDTIEQIDIAYDEIIAKEAAALVIDLRENTGGAFAVRPLVSRLLAAPIDAGSFVAQRWNAAHNSPPGPADLEAVAPWQGWSIKAFWADVQTDSLTRIHFMPVEPVFDGPVYVLTSNQTASAAELAVDALQGAGRAVVIGETTAGEMLSQKIYDIPGGLQLSLPIADYYSVASGRIEGAGVKPDIATEALQALEVVLAQIGQEARSHSVK